MDFGKNGLWNKWAVGTNGFGTKRPLDKWALGQNSFGTNRLGQLGTHHLTIKVN